MLDVRLEGLTLRVKDVKRSIEYSLEVAQAEIMPSNHGLVSAGTQRRFAA
jgi:hypothetical protein